MTYRFTSAAATSVCLASFGLSPSLGFCAPSSAFTLSETALRFMLGSSASRLHCVSIGQIF